MKPSRFPIRGGIDTDIDTREVPVVRDLSGVDTSELPMARVDIEDVIDLNGYIKSRTIKVVNITIKVLNELDKFKPRSKDENRVYRKEFNALLAEVKNELPNAKFVIGLEKCIVILRNFTNMKLPGNCNGRISEALKTLEEDTLPKLK